MAEALRAEGLSKNFGGLLAVNRVNFQVLEGQTAGIIGPNGSGKTTLFNLLSGHLPPSKGRIHFLGREVTDTLPHLRVRMGMARTFQLVSVFHSLTVWENLVLSSIRFRRAEHTLRNFFLKPAQKTEILEECRRSLAEVGLENKAGQRTAELSYGEKRMLELAMALALKPNLLLLDEPLSGLSDHEIGGVVDLLHRVKKDFTVVIIEHKISKIVDLVERLSVMNDGQIICEGEPGRVLTDAKVRECYWGGET
ncbi:MAG: ATP-binding cassette domain-containing protein [Syntrophaceae bacterium]|jgi:branched-chain amino acid transport system ATP-binding protein|nr:ATP-binding cassette domain-containing protein [Syntrophaceae bacterium]